MANLFLNLAMFIAFVRIEIGLALLVFYSYPAFVALASVIWFGERLDAVRWSALVVSMLGLTLTLAGAGDLGELDVVGIGLAFLAALTQAFYVLAARHGFPHVPPHRGRGGDDGRGDARLPGHRAGHGSAGLAGCAAGQQGGAGARAPGRVHRRGDPDPLLHHRHPLLGPPRAAILATLEPVVGVALAAWLLGEQPAALQLVGGALILVAAVLLQVRRHDRFATTRRVARIAENAVRSGNGASHRTRPPPNSDIVSAGP